jgi:outer membrane receptor protein involved in Fe transport
VDRDWAAFAEGNWDITSHLTATVGFRRFRFDNTLEGFNGLGEVAFGLPPPPPAYPGGPPGPGGIIGQQTCLSTTPYRQAPCLNFGGLSEGWGSTPKFNLSYKFDADHLVYATFSRGFRPGGVNQNAGVPEFGPDYLSNYEVGWKTAWFDRHLIFNGALYYERWKNFQFRYLAPHGLPLIANAGDAEVKGAEGELQWLVTRGLNLSASVSYNDAYLKQNYCGLLNPNGTAVTSNDCTSATFTTPSTPIAPAGQKLPFTPLFKTSLQARYSFPFMNETAFVEGDEVYQGAVYSSLRNVDRSAFGQQGAFGVTNFSLGINKNSYEIELLVKNAFNRLAVENSYAELTEAQSSIATFQQIIPPRLIGLQFSQQF